MRSSENITRFVLRTRRMNVRKNRILIILKNNYREIQLQYFNSYFYSHKIRSTASHTEDKKATIIAINVSHVFPETLWKLMWKQESSNTNPPFPRPSRFARKMDLLLSNPYRHNACKPFFRGFPLKRIPLTRPLHREHVCARDTSRSKRILT